MPPGIDLQKLLDENCKFRVVSTSHLADLQSEIENRQSQGQFDKEFADRYLPTFRFKPPEALNEAKSIVIVAMPRPPTKATFSWNGKKQTFILPPTYTAYDEKRIHIEHMVLEAVGKRGYRIATPKLPLKLLAARSGLAEYGRNNITYVQGMGSFMRLAAVYSDMPCENDQWQKAKTMKRCEGCDLCQKACPTRAISKDRFLLHAEKCLTYHNEKEGNIPFPAWIKPEWHNCIVGCIRCQAACPENKPFLNQVGETAEFDEEETKLLLKGTSRNLIPLSTLKKTQQLSLTDYLNEIPRNLQALLH
ncbi:MAG: 4Fe-4S double cluster binding domain-containing protein [Candidatus Bathyarchaeia archaeon]